LAHTELKVTQVLREGDPKHELPKAAEEWATIVSLLALQDLAIVVSDLCLGFSSGRGLLKQFPMLTPVESAVAEDVNAPEIVIFGIRLYDWSIRRH
jgi:hypothetical protein